MGGEYMKIKRIIKTFHTIALVLINSNHEYLFCRTCSKIKIFGRRNVAQSKPVDMTRYGLDKIMDFI